MALAETEAYHPEDDGPVYVPEDAHIMELSTEDLEKRLADAEARRKQVGGFHLVGEVATGGPTPHEKQLAERKEPAQKGLVKQEPVTTFEDSPAYKRWQARRLRSAGHVGSLAAGN